MLKDIKINFKAPFWCENDIRFCHIYTTLLCWSVQDVTKYVNHL